MTRKGKAHENRTKEGLRTGVRTSVEQTTLLANPVYVGQAQGEKQQTNKKHKKRSQSVAGRGGAFPGPELGSCLTLRNELSEETHADKARDFIGKGHPGREQEDKGTQENCSATGLTVSDFMVMGLVSGWSLANHSNSVFPGGARISAKMDASERDSGKWTDRQCLLSTFPELFRLVMAY